ILVWNYYVHYGRNGQLINLIPGPPGYPIAGNLLQFLGSLEKQWKFLTTHTNQYYPILKIWAFSLPVVSIRHPDDLQTILSSTKHIEKELIFNVLQPLFGTGLVTSAGDKWHSRRKLLTPTFNFNILQQFVKVFIEEGEKMTKSLKKTEGIVVKDLIPFLNEHTLNAICETAMGISVQDLGAFQQRYKKAFLRISELASYRLIRPWLHSDWIFSLTPEGREQTEVLKILHEVTEKQVIPSLT
ncbi:PREDICTED: cytochrome P450 4C1-like, partial [Wasmannia auropunctata]|uniref:cytochrome P450 4C1-like n=1 Tax=Wasmannia auropunctata TaxID=64793 RepID=UPI0005EE7C3D